MITSPYQGLPIERWEQKTRDLITEHPLDPEELVEIVLGAWEDIFQSIIGRREFRIGSHLFPKPQIMAFFLHELIALELSVRYPGIWRGDQSAEEKDLVYVPNPFYSVEIKTSSHTSRIFGNRSYAQKTSVRKKVKSGYYLAINFQKFKAKLKKPEIILIRFGWLDYEDWVGQTAATGQQARLRPEAERYKLLPLYIKR